MQLNCKRGHGVQTTSHIIYNGKAQTVKIKTGKGYEVEGARDHRILVLANSGEFIWRELKNLCQTDRICLNRKGYWGVNEMPLINEFRASKKEHSVLQLPERMNEDLARLLGYFVAEGWYLKQQNGADAGIGIANQDAELIEDLNLIANSFGLRLRNGGNRCRWHLNNCDLARLFHNFGLDGRRAAEKHIPNIIRRSPKEIIAAFLRAYFDGDGTVSSYLSCTTASEKLAGQLQQLLLNFGIVSKLQPTLNKKYGKTFFQIQIDSENIEIFNREIGFGLTRKREAAAKLELKTRSRHRDGLPNLQIHWATIQAQLQLLAKEQEFAGNTDYRNRIGVRQTIGDLNYEQLWRFARGASTPSLSSAQTLVKSLPPPVSVPNVLSEAINSQFFFDKISEISEGYDDLWDFCVPGKSHLYRKRFCSSQLRREISLLPLDSLAGTKHQDRALCHDLR